MTRHERVYIAGVAALLLALSALVPAAHAGEAEWVLDLTGEGSFYDLPWPTELRRRDDGTLRTDDFRISLFGGMAAGAREAVSQTGHSTVPTVFFRFTSPVDRSLDRLEPAEGLADDGRLFLVDIDPASPERGRRFPVFSRTWSRAPRLMWGVGGNLLALGAEPGFVLRPNTLYAAGVRTTARDARGEPLTASPVLQELAGGRVPEGPLGSRAADLYAPALVTLQELGVAAPADLAALTVFRTDDPTDRMERLYRAVRDREPPEWIEPLAVTRTYDGFTVLEGTLRMPQFQEGKPPYKGGGGRIFFEGPTVRTARFEAVPVAVTVPHDPMPEAGYPLLVYIHGTGGDSVQVVDRGVGGVGVAPPGTGPAMVLAHRGWAAIGAAQPQNGQRGGDPEMDEFYNFRNPQALRDNLLQGAAEASLLLTRALSGEIDASLVPDADTGGRPIRFDPQHVAAMGQSLGSAILAPWVAVDDRVGAVIPSGTGAYYTLFIAESNPLDKARLRKTRRGQGDVWGITRTHPALAFTTEALAPSELAVWQDRLVAHPLPGRPPRHVYASYGLYDHYFYPVSQNASILALEAGFAGASLDPSTTRALDLSGISRPSYPVRANVKGVTAVSVQARQLGALDGHHVNFQRDDTRYQWGCFLETWARDGVPTVPAPAEPWDAPCP